VENTKVGYVENVFSVVRCRVRAPKVAMYILIQIIKCSIIKFAWKLVDSQKVGFLKEERVFYMF
jgi:hypothetical protein